MSRYRQLDDAQILQTLTRLRARIGERFPESGLSRVAEELVALAREDAALMRDLQRPHWPIRIAASVILLVLAAVLVVALRSASVSNDLGRIGDLIQATDAAFSTIAFLGAGAFFLLTLETRLKRKRALAELHQLRSVAHIVDMHQLTKDPERIASGQPDTESSPARLLTPPELGRYLDYCSELLAVISKLAALLVQHFSDPVTLDAVNDVELLTTGLSNKIWQKITLLERTRAG